MAGLIEKSLLLGLGMLTLTRDKVAQFVDKLVEEGEIKSEDAPGFVNRLVVKGKEEREELRKLVRQELDRVTPTTRQDIEELNRKIEALAVQIEKLAREQVPEE